MINQQLVDYIKQQMQAGVSKDAVRKALADAGWPAADIDDSIKAGDTAAPATAAAPAGATAGPAAQPKIDPMVAMGGTDAVSSSKFFTAAKPSAAMASIDEEDDDHPSAKKFLVSVIAMGTVIVLLAGALAFVYFNLNAQLKEAQNGIMPAGSDQAASLQAKVSELTKSNEDLNAQVSSMTVMNSQLAAEVAFFAAPAANATSSSATVQGLLTGNASQSFVLTTVHNVKVYVANYKDPKVAAALTPLANGTSTVTLTGTHAVASPNLTVTAVNGTAL